jgi:hypothetical protein
MTLQVKLLRLRDDLKVPDGRPRSGEESGGRAVKAEEGA